MRDSYLDPGGLRCELAGGTYAVLVRRRSMHCDWRVGEVGDWSWYG